MKKIVSVLLTLVLVFTNTYVVKSAELNDINSIRSKNYIYNKDFTDNGVFSTNTFFFNVSEQWKIKNSYVNVVFTQSDLLDKDNSTLTLLLNDYPIFSTKLVYKNKYKNSLKVKLPVDKITKGFNEIKIKTYKRISEKPCTDDKNNGNWIVIHKESYVHIDFFDRKDSLGLKEFPFPYIKESDEIPINSKILVSDSCSRGEVTAAMMLCANFGSKRKFENINTNVYKFSQVSEKTKSDIIFIGLKDKSSKDILGLLTDREIKASEKSAVIKEVSSPYNKNKKMLIIISNDDNKLIKAAQLLCSKELMKQINSNSISVGDNLNVKDIKNKQREKVYLYELGYNNIHLQGPFRQEAYFTLNIPKNKLIKKGAKIILNTRYSKNLDFDRSLVTVYINDIPIGSKKLDAKNSDNDIFQVDIPEDVRKFSYYEIKVAFDLQLKDVFCSIREEQTPWAYILNQSYVYLPYTQGREFIFENYPSPLISDGEFKDLTVVLPENLSSEILTWTGNIMGYLGHYIESNRGELNVIRSNEFSNNIGKGNLIVIGTPKDNKTIKDMNKNMHIKFTKDFSAFESNEKINLIKGYNNKIATIQLIKSPYSSDGKAMVVTAVNYKDIYLAQRYLKDLNLSRSLQGNSVIIDRDGNLNNFNYGGEKEKISDWNFVKNINLNYETKTLILVFLILIFILVISIMFFIKKYKDN